MIPKRKPRLRVFAADDLQLVNKLRDHTTAAVGNESSGRERNRFVTRTPGRVRNYPYYKVQVRDPVSLVWKDHRKEAFDDEAAAQVYRMTIREGIETRVVKWDRSGSTPLKDTES